LEVDRSSERSGILRDSPGSLQRSGSRQRVPAFYKPAHAPHIRVGQVLKKTNRGRRARSGFGSLDMNQRNGGRAMRLIIRTMAIAVWRTWRRRRACRHRIWLPGCQPSCHKWSTSWRRTAGCP